MSGYVPKVHYQVERGDPVTPIVESACGMRRNQHAFRRRKIDLTCVPAKVTCIVCIRSEEYQEMLS